MGARPPAGIPGPPSPNARPNSSPPPPSRSSASTPRWMLQTWITCSDLGFPGEYPYTRGVHPTMHRSRLWTMRMFAGFGTAEETNARFKYLLEQGQTGLSIAFDLPTLMGYDTDAPEAAGRVRQVRRGGLLAARYGDPAGRHPARQGLHQHDHQLARRPSSGPCISPPPKSRVCARISCAAPLQNDILKEYIAQKEYIFPPEPSMRLVVDTIEFGTQAVPQWNTISISGYHIREAGSHRRPGAGLHPGRRDGIRALGAAARAWISTSFAPRLSFFFNAHNDFFEEIAKYRAARRIWAREMRDTFGAKQPRSWLMRFHTQTAGVSLTAQQPENNIVRVALQALAAVLGGTQSLHTNSMDEALALPSEHAVTIALRTQQIIAEESGVANTVDPLAGSFFVEAQTNRIEAQAYDYFRRIDELGGVLPAIDKGFFQSEISDAAYRYQREIDRRQRRIVGVNAYAGR